MTDKEVGAIWRLCQDKHKFYEQAVIRKLIQKLVEDRANAHAIEIREALRDFGISPKEWNK